ncbi:MAG: type I-E CRISPR-associated protein Cse2/CasB [Methanoculleaceae archaeon]
MQSSQQYLKIDDGQVISTIVDWWRSLENKRGDRADLRRCRGPEDVFFVPEYHRLLSLVREHGKPKREEMAIIAGILSHVKKNDQSKPVAAQMGQIKGAGNSPLVSETRFRRLMHITTPEELYPAMIRLVRHLDGTVNIPDLVQSMYWWNDRTRKDWALKYFEQIV